MFADPEIVATLQKQFIALAADVWYEQRRQDEGGAFFYHVVDQGRNKGKDRDLTRQGLYCFTSDGTLLSDDNHRSPERLKALLQRGLERLRTLPAPGNPGSLRTDQRYQRALPPGGLIADVFGKILLEGTALEQALKINGRNGALSRDHLWITPDEVRALAPTRWQVGFRYAVPRAVAMRIARFHLVDNVRGEPPMWERDEVTVCEMSLEVTQVNPREATMRLTGKAAMESARQGQRTYLADLAGDLIYDVNRQTFRRFDLLALGQGSGAGTYTPGCPPGRFPLAIVFTLANSAREASRVPPQGARSLPGYLAAER